MTSAVTVSALASNRAPAAGDHPRHPTAGHTTATTSTPTENPGDRHSDEFPSVVWANHDDTTRADQPGNGESDNIDSDAVHAGARAATPTTATSPARTRTALMRAALQTMLATVVAELDELAIDERLAARMPHARSWLAETRTASTRWRAVARDLCARLDLPPVTTTTARGAHASTPPGGAR